MFGMKKSGCAVGAAVLLLGGCVTVPPETGSTNSQMSTPSAAQDKPRENQRTISVPKSTSLQEFKEQYGLLGEVVDADAFVRDFRPEEYVSKAEGQEWIRTTAIVELNKKKYPNSFEREMAISEFTKNYIPPLINTRSLPDYLVFRTNFAIMPSRYITAKQLYLMEPILTYEKNGIVQVPIQRNCSRPNCVDWNYFKNSTQQYVRPEYKFNHNVWIEHGTMVEEMKLTDYTKRETNRFAIVPMSHEEFRANLANGYNPERNPNVSFYAGWSIAQVDKSKSSCKNPNRPYQTPSPTCRIQVNPVKYVVENLNGKARTEFTPKMADVLKL